MANRTVFLRDACVLHFFFFVSTSCVVIEVKREWVRETTRADDKSPSDLFGLPDDMETKCIHFRRSRENNKKLLRENCRVYVKYVYICMCVRVCKHAER